MRLVSNEEDAWDALQETWLALIKGIDKLRDPRALVLWLYKTARHKAMDRLRTRYDDRRVSMDGEEIPEFDEGGEECGFEDAELVHSKLAELSMRSPGSIDFVFSGGPLHRRNIAGP